MHGILTSASNIPASFDMKSASVTLQYRFACLQADIAALAPMHPQPRAVSQADDQFILCLSVFRLNGMAPIRIFQDIGKRFPKPGASDPHPPIVCM